jgi:hypothetical protein
MVLARVVADHQDGLIPSVTWPCGVELAPQAMLLPRAGWVQVEVRTDSRGRGHCGLS